MNFTEVKGAISKILNGKRREHKCILLDGIWGIGKTCTLDKWISEDNNFIMRSISAFGRESIQDIEREIVIQVVTYNRQVSELQKKIKIKNFERYKAVANKLKFAANVLNETWSGFSGNRFNFGIGSFVEGISIDDLAVCKIEGVSSFIICIDDVERVSDSVKLKDLMGLIERVKKVSDVIVLANTPQIKDTDYKAYKEKVIDYEFRLDEIEPPILVEIAKEELQAIQITQIEKIIEVYNDFGSMRGMGKENPIPHQNIRVFKKYIGLICSLNEKIEHVRVTKEFELPEEFLYVAREVVFEEFLEGDSSRYNHKRNSIHSILKRLLNFEEIDSSKLEELLIPGKQISKDILELYNAYKLQNQEYDTLINRINKNILEKNSDYFISQSKIISLYDALVLIDDKIEIEENLLEIACILYTPQIDKEPIKYYSEDWSDVGPTGEIQCPTRTKEFIERLNILNESAFNIYIGESFKQAIEELDFKKLSTLHGKQKIIGIELFERLFDAAFYEIERKFDDELWRFIEKLVENYDTISVDSFLKDRLKKEYNIIKRQRYYKLLENLSYIDYLNRLNEID